MIIVVFFKAKTPEQWESSTKTVPKSPPCMGGSKRWKEHSIDGSFSHLVWVCK